MLLYWSRWVLVVTLTFALSNGEYVSNLEERGGVLYIQMLVVREQSTSLAYLIAWQSPPNLGVKIVPRSVVAMCAPLQNSSTKIGTSCTRTFARVNFLTEGADFQRDHMRRSGGSWSMSFAWKFAVGVWRSAP